MSSSTGQLSNKQKEEIVALLRDAAVDYNNEIKDYYDSIPISKYKDILVDTLNTSPEDIKTGIIKMPKLPSGHSWSIISTISTDELKLLCQNIFYQLAVTKSNAFKYNKTVSFDRIPHYSGGNYIVPRLVLPRVILPSFCNVSKVTCDFLSEYQRD